MTLPQILSECARLAGGGGAGALASVARRRGSLPMSGTAKMLVAAGGARLGTVGGGCLEAEITARALEVVETRRPLLSAHTLNAELAGDYGLTCGGTAHLFIEPVLVDGMLAELYGECARVLACGGRAVVATQLDWTRTPRKLLLLADGRTIGAVDRALRERAERLEASAELPALGEDGLIEPLTGPPRLLVFGGGHVGARVAEAARFAGWRVTIVDDRAEYADAARHPYAERTVVCDFADLPATLGIDEATYAVVATRGHQHDADIVDQLARRPIRYLGMLGSRRKVQLTWGLLERAGVPRAHLERIHAPVGIAIGADTPEEIAVSVVAEMVAVRRTGTRRRGGGAGLPDEHTGSSPGPAAFPDADGTTMPDRTSTRRIR